ncbi:MAG: NAD(P)H-dependent glycerol-3-phosphate dehydrogenase [Candidatus Hodarchaeota archaeon]
MTLEISVIGAGGWGTTLGNLQAKKGFKVKIWCYEKKTAEDININHQNHQFLPGVPLSEDLIAYTDFNDVVPDADVIIFAVPSGYLRSVANQIKSYFLNNKDYKLISVAKGLEHETFKLMTEVLREILPNNIKIAALSGPNHAEEVSRDMPTATVIASIHEEILDELVEFFRTDYFRPYSEKDERGIQICGAVKNITAMAVGVGDGLGLGDNAKASIMTLGLAEMYRIGKHFGCERRTIFGIAGVGDLIATCSSKHSRNRFFGEKLAEGKSLEQIKEELHGMMAEGVWAVESVYHFAQEHNLDLPLTNQFYKVLYENKKMSEAITDLLALI